MNHTNLEKLSYWYDRLDCRSDKIAVTKITKGESNPARMDELQEKYPQLLYIGVTREISWTTDCDVKKYRDKGDRHAVRLIIIEWLEKKYHLSPMQGLTYVINDMSRSWMRD